MEIKTEYFNEVFEPEGKVRERYRPLFEALEHMGEEEFATRCERAGEKLRELGATFPLPDDPEGQDRILPADWIPRIIPKDHREILATGLLQVETPSTPGSSTCTTVSRTWYRRR